MTRRLVATFILLLTLAAAVLAQDSLSSQVLQLLTRLNNWVVLQTYWAGIRFQAGVPADTSGVLYRSGDNLYWNGAQVAGSGSATAPHTILGTTHSDAATDSVTRGSVIIGNSTPAWDELVVGTAGQFLRTDGTDVAWGTDGSALTNLPAANLTGTLPAISGVNLTNLNASNLASGTVPVGRLAGLITDTEISASAAISYSKLDLASSIILTSDVNGILPRANGGTGTSGASDDQILVDSGSAWVAKTLPDCNASTSALQYDQATNAFSCGTVSTATGTVTSVALSLPGVFSIAGSPVTTSGTLSASLVTQTANTVWAGPTTGSAAAPTFRALVNADLPLSGAAAGTISGLTINPRGVITAQVALVAADLPTVTIAKGGTGLTTLGNDAIVIGSGATNGVATTIRDCEAGALAYDQTTNVISCSAFSSATVTFTNKTLDVEASGNVVTTVEREWWDVAICTNVTAVLQWSTPTADPGVAACVTGSNTQKGVVDFADGGNSLSIEKQFRLPADWTGNIDAKLVWHTTATSNAVVWQISTTCVADAETGDPAYGAAATVTDVAKGSASQYNDATINTLTTTGCAAGEVLYLKVFRDPAHGDDSLAATARLVGLELTYRRSQ